MLDATGLSAGETADDADKPNYAQALQIPAAPVIPVSVDRAPAPPKPTPAPNRQLACERIRDKAGEIIGLDLTPLPGNAITKIELRSMSKDGKFRVAVLTAPRRGRSFKSQRAKKEE